MWQVANQLFWRRISVLTFKTHLTAPAQSISLWNSQSYSEILHSFPSILKLLFLQSVSFGSYWQRDQLGREQTGFVHSFIPISSFAYAFSPQEKTGRTVKSLETVRNQKDNESNFLLHLLWKKLFLWTAPWWDLIHLSGSSWSWSPWLSLIASGGKKYFSGTILLLQIFNPGWTNSHTAVSSLKFGLPSWMGIPTWDKTNPCFLPLLLVPAPELSLFLVQQAQLSHDIETLNSQ